MSDAINPDHYKQGSIQCIDAMKIVLTPEEFRGYLKGNVFKYLWREKDKNGIEDLRKARWYLDRLIEHCDLRESLLDISNGLVKAWICENGKAKQVSPEQPQLPDGWRWLEVGEVIRKRDRYWFQDAWNARGDDLDGCKYSVHHCQTIRRNRFEVGEKVVEFIDSRIGVVKDIEGIGSGKAFLYHVEMQDTKGMILFSPHQLAPYIEEQS